MGVSQDDPITVTYTVLIVAECDGIKASERRTFTVVESGDIRRDAKLTTKALLSILRSVTLALVGRGRPN